ncbi:hypothetical protein ACO0K9_06495 [Undibacterium sp. Ji50W]|uniref:hypothetical protein n=1 Tax=Undibacterium sp. Ji50W TaxID=3413041 RepID=UPI003BF420A1
MEKEEPMFERSEFRIFPFLVLDKREPRRGDDAWVAFLAYLFGEAKRYVAAGLPPACDLNTTDEDCKNNRLVHLGIAMVRTAHPTNSGTATLDEVHHKLQ